MMATQSKVRITTLLTRLERQFVAEYEREVSQSHDDCIDETGTISLLGKTCEVQTAYWGGVQVWELVRSGPTWPHCETCSAPLDIGTEMIWRCGMCEQERIEKLRTERAMAAKS